MPVLSAEEKADISEQGYLQSGGTRGGIIDSLPKGLLQAQQLAVQSVGRWRVWLLRVVYVL